MFFVVKRNFTGGGFFSAFLLRAALLIGRGFIMFGLICAAGRCGEGDGRGGRGGRAVIWRGGRGGRAIIWRGGGTCGSASGN